MQVKPFKVWCEDMDNMSNKELYNHIMRKNTSSQNPIDADRFPNRESEGLEGPFRFKNGRILYYDKREGKYYDPLIDMFLGHDEALQAMN